MSTHVVQQIRTRALLYPQNNPFRAVPKQSDAQWGRCGGVAICDYQVLAKRELCLLHQSSILTQQCCRPLLGRWFQLFFKVQNC